ncbi:MAG: hypothetical protein BGO51_00135 [Rhodospirillales bacterium 69-11]|nr:MAG: hypothetical protein BGO51_00135 [Rhodospirillales bacterium 69-11]
MGLSQENCHMSFRLAAIVTASLVALAGPATAGPGAPGHKDSASALLGSPAAKGQGRLVKVEMTDNAYSIAKVDVKAGETIRFQIVNKGTLLHEFNLNTAEEHAQHKPMMAMMMEHGMITVDSIKNLKMKMPDGTVMAHTEPNSVLVEPGKSAEISWKFTRAGTLDIACNIPGHSESGMVIPLTVVAR